MFVLVFHLMITFMEYFLPCQFYSRKEELHVKRSWGPIKHPKQHDAAALEDV